jgi:primosomal protein N' (replication factor Y)
MSGGPRPAGGGPEDAGAAPPRVVSVALPLPLDRTLDYAVPDGWETPAPGTLVEAPVGKGAALGVVWGPGGWTAADGPARLRPLSRLLDEPPLRPGLMAFLSRAADYTLTPPGLMARLSTRAPGLGEAPPARDAYAPGPAAPDPATPARLRALAALAETGGAPMAPSDLARAAGVSAGVLSGMAAQGSLVRVRLARDRAYPPLDPARPGRPLSPAQGSAAAALRAAVAAGGFGATLLRGVTGSGKTEVYLEAVAQALSAGRQALILLPEIALTAGFLSRVADRFGEEPPQWHSDVPPAERRRLWRAVATGDARLVVGARSALFLPFADLALTVVDEEHDGAYKQEDGVLYHARDMAVLRASCEGAQVVLASATPSLESWINAEQGRYRRLDLPERFGAAALPRLAAVDLRRSGPPRDRWISPALAQAVSERLEAREQSLLFLNRRGYAPLTLCRACGHFFECPDCDARLVEHRFRARLVCHQCGHAEPAPAACPACGATDRLHAAGPGVERLAEEAQALWPGARVAILSSDGAESATALRAQVEAIAEGAADVVIGTQIVAKGHNFPLLTLVGVIDADLGLQNGDLRAAERTFQLVRQVTGRAGRADRPGVALIQTVAPEHPVMRAILSGDEAAFLSREADARRAAGMPPFGRLAAAILSGPDEAKTWEAAKALARGGPALEAAGVRLFGPVAAPVARIRGRWRVRFLAKAPRGAPLQAALRDWAASARPPASVRLTLDVDPQSFL